ncbi:hypothetical protein [Megamonas funiformis]|uniref:hypothetical protein n=1 Tax=Megamonas funiformis TaxID=437897 RepID=UPI00033BA19F|nr:hypothetical protein [Megamonas funiformis]CDB97259.1 putative uncharacterized protein [Megamonas funiformis CAG:377]
MIKISPIIHSRTYYCDFNPKFIVRPEGFSDEDISWIRKRILIATSDINRIPDERWICINYKGKIIAGIVCFINRLIIKCNANDNNFTKDEKGRNIYAFIGVVIENKTNNVSIDLNHNFLLNLYNEYIPKLWEKKVLESIQCKYKEIDKKLINNNNSPIKEKVKSIKNLVIYETDINDKDLFNYYLSQNKSFCSNIINFNDVKNIINEDIFSAISTSNNLIKRLNNDTIFMEQAKSNKNITSSRTNYSINNSQEKKTVSLSMNWKLLLIGIIVILLLIILLKK